MNDIIYKQHESLDQVIAHGAKQNTHTKHGPHPHPSTYPTHVFHHLCIEITALQGKRKHTHTKHGPHAHRAKENTPTLNTDPTPTPPPPLTLHVFPTVLHRNCSG